MTEFDSKETYNKYIEVAKKYGLRHVLWERNHVVTIEDIENLERSLSGEEDTEIHRIPFEEFP